MILDCKKLFDSNLDYKIAFKWITLAAEHGHAKAHTNIALKYAFAKGGGGVMENKVYAHMRANLGNLNGSKKGSKGALSKIFIYK